MLGINKWVVLAIAHLTVVSCLAIGVFTVAWRLGKRVEGSVTLATNPPSPAELARFNLLCDQIDVIQNNLSNADTMAFKRQRVNVEEGTPPRMSAFQLDMTQGPLQSTGSPLDLAIQGGGFFRIKVRPELGDGNAYTRIGSLYRDGNGRLGVGIGDGYPLMPAITIPVDGTNIAVDQDGTVRYHPSGSTTSVVAGRINLSQFVHPEAMRKLEGFYLPTPESGDPTTANPGERGLGVVIQSYLEGSNVDPHKEWAALVRAQKMLDMNNPVLAPAVRMKVETAPHHPLRPGSAGV